MRYWSTLILSLGLLFLLYIESPLVRHAAVQGMAGCSVQQYLGIPSAPDLLAFGSSRVRQGIAAEEIKNASDGRFAENYNLGRSGISAPRDFLILRDLLDRGVRPRAVFLELDLDSLFKGTDTELLSVPKHAALMKYSDLNLLKEAQPDLNEFERTRLTVLASLEKLRNAIAAFVSGVPIKNMIVAIKAPHHCRPSEMAVGGLGEQLRARVKLARELKTNRHPIGLAPNNPAARQVLFFLNRTREMCQKYGIVLLVARPGAIGDYGLAPADEAAVKALVPEFVQPPQDLALEIWPYFDDENHMGPIARSYYSRWLAKILIERSGG